MGDGRRAMGEGKIVILGRVPAKRALKVLLFKIRDIK
jgi:hypothetical protein